MSDFKFNQQNIAPAAKLIQQSGAGLTLELDLQL